MGIGKYLTAFDHVVKACRIFEQTGIKEYSIAFFLHCALDICLTLLKAVKAGEGKFERTHSFACHVTHAHTWFRTCTNTTCEPHLFTPSTHNQNNKVSLVHSNHVHPPNPVSAVTVGMSDAEAKKLRTHISGSLDLLVRAAKRWTVLTPLVNLAKGRLAMINGCHRKAFELFTSGKREAAAVNFDIAHMLLEYYMATTSPIGPERIKVRENESTIEQGALSRLGEGELTNGWRFKFEC